MADVSDGSASSRTQEILPEAPPPKRTRKRAEPAPAAAERPPAAGAGTPVVPPPPANPAPPAPAVPVAVQPVVVAPSPEPYPASQPSEESRRMARTPAAPVIVEHPAIQQPAPVPQPPATPPVAPPPAPPSAALPVPVAGPERQEQYTAGLRALQEAFAIDIAEREDRHRNEVSALQQSFANETAARDNHHRSEMQALQQRFAADIATREERHQSELAAMQQTHDELRTQLTELGTTRGREAEARATAEAELEWHRGELQAHRGEISRLKAQGSQLSTQLAEAQQTGERWSEQARRLDADLATTRAEAEQAATAAAGHLDRTTRNLADTAERLNESQELGARLAEQGAALEVAGQQLRRTIEEQRAARDRLTEERDAERQRAAELEAQLRTAEFEAEQAADEASRQLTDVTRRLELAEEHAARLGGQTAVHDATLEDLRNVLAELQGEHKRVSLEHGAAKLRITELEEELAVLRPEPVEEETLAAPDTMPKSRPASYEESAEDVAGFVPPVPLAEGIELVRWQREALTEWAKAGHRGVVESISDAGSAAIAYWAIAEAIDLGLNVLVIAPTVGRADAWFANLREALPINRVGKHAAGRDERLGSFDVVVATASDAAHEAGFASHFKGLIVADEVHVYGTPDLSLALNAPARRRLGLTTSYERDDDGVETFLDPYFGGVCYALDYERALDDGVIAPFDIATVAVRLTPAEQAEYDKLGQQMTDQTAALVRDFAVPGEPAERFLAAVGALASGRVGAARNAARGYQKTVARRGELVDKAADKAAALKAVAARVRDGEKALVFAANQQAASHVSSVFERESCVVRRADGVGNDIALLVTSRNAPLGTDSSDIGLAVVVGASADKRQLLRRVGTVIAPKADGAHGRLVVVYVDGTAETDTAGFGAPYLPAVTPYAATTVMLSGAETDELRQFLLPASGAAPDAAPSA